jgi:intracellular septation protein A
MTVTLYFAIGMGAILDPDPLQAKIWTSTIYTLTAFILMTSSLMSFIQSERERRAWIGFSVFGWAYLLLLGFELSDQSGSKR